MALMVSITASALMAISSPVSSDFMYTPQSALTVWEMVSRRCFSKSSGLGAGVVCAWTRETKIKISNAQRSLGFIVEGSFVVVRSLDTDIDACETNSHSGAAVPHEYCQRLQPGAGRQHRSNT